MKKWIAVVNRVEARIFSGKDFSLLATLVNPLGREKDKVLMSDKPGSRRAKFIGSSQLYYLSGEKDPHEYAAVDFARQVSRYLRKHKSLNHFDEVLITAEPKMLGRIKAQMTTEMSRAVRWLAKDFGKLKDHDLKKKWEALKSNDLMRSYL